MIRRTANHWLNSPTHPVWSLARLAVVNGSVLIALWLNTKHWDTEFMIVAGVLGASSGVEVVGQVLTRLGKTK